MTQESDSASSGLPAARNRAAGEGGSGIEDGPRRPRTAIKSIALTLALVGAGAAYWYFNRPWSEPAEAAVPPAPPVVTVSAPLQRPIVEWDEYTGQFAAVEYVEVRARVSGYLDAIHFEDGQIVEKGDLLFVIDPRPFEIALASARAQLAEATARLELADAQLARANRLRDTNVVAASTYDERLQDKRAAEADVEAARAAVRAAELDLAFTRVTAPITGRVSRNEVSVGSLVSGGSGGGTTLLTTIVSLDPIYFEFDLSEANFLAYQRAVADGRLESTRNGGIAVQVRLPDEKDWSRAREGRIDFVDNQVDRSTGTIRVRAVLPNPDLFITPGQFGRLRLPGSELYEAILVPDSAVVTDQSRKVVMVVTEDGTVEPRVVRPGPMELGLRVIREGLAPTDQLVINGLMRIRPGIKVTPQPGSIEPGQPQG